MAAFPDIQRYFLEGAKDEVFHLLRELGQERARVTDVHDAVGRIRSLRERLDEIDPHYRYELATGTAAANSRPSDIVFSVSFNDVRVDVYPKYLGASEDRPITIRVNVVDDPEFEAIQSALDYGLGTTIPPHLVSSLVVDAPAGLGGSFTGYGIDVLPIDTKLDAPSPSRSTSWTETGFWPAARFISRNRPEDSKDPSSPVLTVPVGSKPA